ncbi:MAG: hypothetical protein ACK5IQ_07290 [Bacteroidales bacterium]
MKIFYVRICSIILLLTLLGNAEGVRAANYFKVDTSYVCGASRSHVYLDKEIGIDNLDVNQGHWLHIHSDMLSSINADLSVLTSNPGMIIDTVSNAFGLTGRPYGAYDLVFVATQDQQCGVLKDSMAYLRLNILPPAEHFYIGELCVSDNGGKILLNDVLAKLMPTFKANRDDITWTRYRKNDAGDLETNNVGLNTSTGEFDMNNSRGTTVTINFTLTRNFPQDTVNTCSDGSITFDVSSEEIAKRGTVESTPFCIEALPDTISLSELMGLGFPYTTGWTNITAGVSVYDQDKFALKQEVRNYITNNGIRPTEFRFKLDRQDLGSSCITVAGYDTLVIKFVDSNFRLQAEFNLADYCQYEDPYIDLYDIMGLALPSNAGTWYSGYGHSLPPMTQDVNSKFFNDGRIVTIGLAPGEYTFTYVIDESIDTTLSCAIGADTVRIKFMFNEDRGIKGTSIEVCEDAASNINLYNILLNYNYNTHKTDGYWHELNGDGTVKRPVTNSEAVSLDLSTQANNTYIYRFTDTTSNFCGNNEAKVYVSKKKNITINSNTTSMCYLFNTADTFNVVAFSGLAGICGTWSWSGITAANVIESDGSVATSGTTTSADGLFFLAHNEYQTGSASPQKEYMFKFTVGTCSGCGLKSGDEFEFKVIITDTYPIP